MKFKSYHPVVGDRVKFMGYIPEQVRWGSGNTTPSMLEKGAVYEISHVDARRSYTKVGLVGYDDLKFNSVHFFPVP